MQLREGAHRKREAERNTLDTSHLKSTHRLTAYLGTAASLDRESLVIEGRSYGEYKGRGFYLERPPRGHEWAIVKDREGLNVLIVRPSTANEANAKTDAFTSGGGCAKASSSLTPDDRYSDKAIIDPYGPGRANPIPGAVPRSKY